MSDYEQDNIEKSEQEQTEEQKDQTETQQKALVEKLLQQREKKNAHNRIYQREKRKRDKQELDTLRARLYQLEMRPNAYANHTVHISDSRMQPVEYELKDETSYMQCIEDLLVTLKGARKITDFTIA